MKHYGDITKLNGGELPVVDVITGGSPCQDLSIAGKRAGLNGERSGLFLQQIRIIREMRDADKDTGRAGEHIRPRFCVWENVYGSLSSNKGRDFQRVLTEFVRIAEPEAPDVPLPDKKWPGAGLLMGDGWSIAWRVLDAQFWGVPQRRRRIALVADFGGRRAGEILFEREGITGYQGTSGTAWKSASSGAGGGDRLPDCASGSGREERQDAGNGWCYPEIARSLLARMDGSPCADRGPDVIVQGFGETGFARWTSEIQTLAAKERYKNVVVHCLSPQDPQSERVYSADGLFPALQANSGGGQSRSAVLVFDARGNGNSTVCPTLTGDHENRVTDYAALCVGNGQLNQISMSERANTLDTMHDQQAILVSAVDCRNGTEQEVNGTLQAKSNGGYSYNTNNTIRQGTIVRRLTPLEAERLQAFPDGWTEVNPITDMSDSDLAFWQNVLFEKAVREGKARIDENDVYVIWRRVTPESKDYDSSHEKDEDGSYWVNTGKPYKHKDKAKMIKWYNRSFCVDTDSARYRALGNSIALPQWEWLAKRIVAEYDRPVTMGSLFDGIAGFPLVFQRAGATPVWASEISEFAIAVSKAHFPEDEKEG